MTNDNILNFKVGDLVIISEEPYEGCFEGDIGYIDIAYSNFCYVHLFRCGEHFAFKYSNFNLLKEEQNAE